MKEENGCGAKLKRQIADLRRQLEAHPAGELATIISAIADGVTISDTEGRLVRYNEAAQRMLHYEDCHDSATYPERVQRCRYLRPDGRQFAIEELPLTRSLQGEIVIGEIIQLIWPDGSCTWVNSSSAPVYNAEGKLTGAVLTTTDITALRQAEEELRHHRDGLELLVQERTAALRSLAAELSLAEERERKRLATALHDDVAQTLAFLKMRVAALRKNTPEGELQEGLVEVHELLGQVIRETRSLMVEMSPPVLYQMGFEKALEWLAEGMEQRHGLAATFATDGLPKPLSREAQIAVYQTVRELLTNVAKHAQATRAEVAVRRVSRYVEVVVRDNGVGFAPDAIDEMGVNGGFGLFNIRERLTYLNGWLEIESAPGAGTCLKLVAPLQEEGD